MSFGTGIKATAWIPVILILLVCSANAGVITTQATCNGSTITGYTSASCSGSGVPGSPPFADATVTLSMTGISIFVEAYEAPAYYTSASATVEDSFLFAATGGLGQGYYSVCVDEGADYFQGGGTVIGTIGNLDFSSNGRVESRYCGPNAPFTVGQTLSVSISASATTWTFPIGDGVTGYGQGNAFLNANLEFFDSSMNPVAGVTLVDLGAPAVPEPGAGWLLTGGLMVLASLRRGDRREGRL